VLRDKSGGLVYHPTLIVTNIKGRAPWFLASVLLHLAVLVMAIALGTIAALPVRQQKEPIMWLIVPPKALPRDLRMQAPGLGSRDRVLSGDVINLSGLRIEVEDAPGFEMLDLLGKNNGKIGFGVGQSSTTNEPVELLYCFDYPGFQQASACGTSDDYFPIKLHNGWPALERLRRSQGLDLQLQAYALFPRNFGSEVRSAVRREAGRKSLPEVNLAILRFIKADNGFEVAVQ
jgi:hypothetical protein